MTAPYLVVNRLPPRQRLDARRSWFDDRAGQVDPEFDDCYDDILAQLARGRVIEPVESVRGRSLDGSTWLVTHTGIGVRTHFARRPRWYGKKPELQPPDPQRDASLAELRAAIAEQAEMDRRAEAGRVAYNERLAIEREERRARNHASWIETQKRHRALLDDERSQSPGRAFSVVGGERVWHDKAVAWLKRYPPGYHRLTALRAAQAQTDAAARCLWDELAVELGLVVA